MTLADIPAIAPHVLGQVARYGCCACCGPSGCVFTDEHNAPCELHQACGLSRRPKENR